MGKAAYVLLLLGFLVGLGYARTWHVPSEAPTIQAGIDSAGVGDVVEIACGTYYENNIQLKSMITIRSENAEPGCVVVDGQNSGRILLASYVDLSTQIIGIEFRNGQSLGYGGAMIADLTSLTFQKCVFANNIAVTGGALSLTHFNGTISECSFIQNQAGVDHGGAIDFRGQSYGVVVDCMFIENSSNQFGGAIFTYQQSMPDIIGCTFNGNTAEQNGGAICIYSDSSPTISQCHFQNNSSPWGGALSISSDQLSTISNCLFEYNYSDFGGAAIYCQSGLFGISNCTIAENTSPNGVGLCCSSIKGESYVDHLIIAFNQGISIYCLLGLPPNITCCNFFGNLFGDWIGAIGDQYGINGNMSMDPIFCAYDDPVNPYSLFDTSPCADDNNIVCGLIGAFGVECFDLTSVGLFDAQQEQRIECSCYPNPFNPSTTIEFTLPDERNTCLGIFDIAGRLIRLLRNDQILGPGLIQVEWDGKDQRGRNVCSGVYVAHIWARDLRAVTRLLLVR